MSFSFRPAKRQNVSLLIGLSAPSGGGKTWSAMLLAKGMAGGKRFCVIDTEAGRALHYADRFDFDHGDFPAPFTPARYAEAIVAADKAGYPVIVVDSTSHEWAGEGGVLDIQETELKRMGGGDNVKMASWIKPKGEHKRMMQQLLQVRAHIILCFRAEAKIDIVKQGGKAVIVPKQTLTSVDGWIPICEKSVPFELTASFLLTPDAPGVPKPIKLQEQHRSFFPTGKPITEAAGLALAQWAAGGASPAVSAAVSPPVATTVATPVAPKEGVSGHSVSYADGVVGVVTPRTVGNAIIYETSLNGEIFSTRDVAMADRAVVLEGKSARFGFTVNANGAKVLKYIGDAA